MSKKHTIKSGRRGPPHPKSGSGIGASGTVPRPDDSAAPSDAPQVHPEAASPVEAPRPTRTPEPSLAPPVVTSRKRGRARQEEIEAERKAETVKAVREETERIERDAIKLAPEAADTLDCVFGVLASILGEHWELKEKERAKLSIRFGRVYAKRGTGSKFLTAWSAELALAGSLSVVCLSRVFGKGIEDDADTHDPGESGVGKVEAGADALPDKPPPDGD